MLQAHSSIGNFSDGHDLRIEFHPWPRMRLQTKATVRKCRKSIGNGIFQNKRHRSSWNGWNELLVGTYALRPAAARLGDDLYVLCEGSVTVSIATG